MKVHVGSNITGFGLLEFPTEVELEESNVTLRGLLESLSGSGAVMEFIKGTEIGSDLQEVLVNGKKCQFLPQGLETRLNEGDEIELIVEASPLGGG